MSTDKIKLTLEPIPKIKLKVRPPLTLEWRPIEGFPNYEISNYGNVRNINTGLILKLSLNDKGYYKVTLRWNDKKSNNRVNRLVAMAFLENTNNLPTVDHMNRNKLDNRVDNLCWATYETQNLNKNPQKTRNGNNVTSKYRGVTKVGKRWRSDIYVNSKHISLGRFNTEIEAVQAFNDYVITNNLPNLLNII